MELTDLEHRLAFHWDADLERFSYLNKKCKTKEHMTG
jgi:hypothetical protein